MVDIDELIKLISAFFEVEKKIERHIKKEKDAKKRKKLLDAFKNRDLDSIRDVLFN